VEYVVPLHNCQVVMLLPRQSRSRGNLSLKRVRPRPHHRETGATYLPNRPGRNGICGFLALSGVPPNPACLQEFSHGSRDSGARLKIVVSPVRVRVSPLREAPASRHFFRLSSSILSSGYAPERSAKSQTKVPNPHGRGPWAQVVEDARVVALVGACEARRLAGHHEPLVEHGRVIRHFEPRRQDVGVGVESSRPARVTLRSLIDDAPCELRRFLQRCSLLRDVVTTQQARRRG
jgi:hypothetical protein